MITEQNLILTREQVNQILRRIAFEIYENNFEESELILVGIYDKGYHLAEIIQKELNEITEGIETTLVRLDIDKQNPAVSEVKLHTTHDKLKGRVIIVVDDVLNTARTMSYSLKVLLEEEVKKIETAVLVNRSHKTFPISANYKGYELSTSIDEHVEVRLDDEPGVYLY